MWDFSWMRGRKDQSPVLMFVSQWFKLVLDLFISIWYLHCPKCGSAQYFRWNKVAIKVFLQGRLIWFFFYSPVCISVMFSACSLLHDFRSPCLFKTLWEQKLCSLVKLQHLFLAVQFKPTRRGGARLFTSFPCWTFFPIAACYWGEPFICCF